MRICSAGATVVLHGHVTGSPQALPARDCLVPSECGAVALIPSPFDQALQFPHCAEAEDMAYFVDDEVCKGVCTHHGRQVVLVEGEEPGDRKVVSCFVPADARTRLPEDASGSVDGGDVDQDQDVVDAGPVDHEPEAPAHGGGELAGGDRDPCQVARDHLFPAGQGGVHVVLDPGRDVDDVHGGQVVGGGVVGHDLDREVGGGRLAAAGHLHGDGVRPHGGGGSLDPSGRLEAQARREAPGDQGPGVVDAVAPGRLQNHVVRSVHGARREGRVLHGQALGHHRQDQLLGRRLVVAAGDLHGELGRLVLGVRRAGDRPSAGEGETGGEEPGHDLPPVVSVSPAGRQILVVRQPHDGVGQRRGGHA